MFHQEKKDAAKEALKETLEAAQDTAEALGTPTVPYGPVPTIIDIGSKAKLLYDLLQEKEEEKQTENPEIDDDNDGNEKQEKNEDDE